MGRNSGSFTGPWMVNGFLGEYLGLGALLISVLGWDL